MMNDHLINIFPIEFPIGLRILLVADDESSIQVIDQMLKSLHYQVTICRQGYEALSILQDNKENYDIVIGDFHIRDMDGLNFIEIVGTKMKIPVIMIAGDETVHDVMVKGIEIGVCDYLIKPISRDVLKLIWQHVVRKKTNELKESEKMRITEPSDSQIVRFSNNVDHEISKEANTYDSLKRKQDVENHESEGCDDVMRPKKPRLVWTSELHQMFIKALNEFGVDRAVPKKILESMQRMGASNITRENIASHLQKYRMYIKKQSCSDCTCPIGPNEHYSLQQQSYAYDDEISIFEAGENSSQVPLTSPRVSQENQLFNPNSSVGVFNDHHMKPYDTRVVLGSGYEMEQQFDNLDIVLPRNQEEEEEEEEEDLILGNTGSQTYMPLPLTSEIEINKEMIISGGMENESCSYVMYSSQSVANGSDQNQGFGAQHVTPLAAMTYYHPSMEVSRQNFPLQHSNHFVYRNECSIHHHLGLIEDHDFRNLGNNVQQHNRTLLENRSTYFHPGNSSSPVLSFDNPSIHHVSQQPLDIDDFRFLEVDPELGENIITSNGYSTSNGV